MIGYSVGIDVGATSIKMALFDSDLQLVSRNDENIFSDKYQLPEGFVSVVGDAVVNMLDKKGLPLVDLSGIGIGLPGCVDSINGTVRDLSNLPDWPETNIKEQMENRLDVPTFIDNDVNIMTIGELVHGAGKGCVNAVCCTLGTGVGGGLVIGGKLYRGTNLCAGEIGHISLFPEDEGCNCGNKGCLENYVGNSAIVERTKKMLKENNLDSAILSELIQNDTGLLTPKIIYEAAVRGDELSSFIWKQTGYYIGMAFANIVNILNPEKIIIGGGVAQAGKILFDSIIETVNSRAIPIATRDLQIVPAQLGEDAGVYGAATYSVRKNFHEER